jgi:hypothetical protein
MLLPSCRNFYMRGILFTGLKFLDDLYYYEEPKIQFINRFTDLSFYLAKSLSLNGYLLAFKSIQLFTSLP